MTTLPAVLVWWRVRTPQQKGHSSASSGSPHLYKEAAQLVGSANTSRRIGIWETAFGVIAHAEQAA